MVDPRPLESLAPMPAEAGKWVYGKWLSGLLAPVADGRIPIGLPGGLAPLDSDGKIAALYLPTSILGQVQYRGLWDASSGEAPTDVPEDGWYYIVTVPGSYELGGITVWGVGDWAIYNDGSWGRVGNTDAVVSVAGLVGAISAGGLKAALAYDAAAVGADAAGTATAAVAAHTGASDPHPQYARKAPKITSAIVSGAVTPEGDTDLVRPPALTAALSIQNPLTTPADGHCFEVALVSVAAQGLTWGSKYASLLGLLPITTVAGSKQHRIGFEYNSADDKLYCRYAQVQP